MVRWVFLTVACQAVSRYLQKPDPSTAPGETQAARSEVRGEVRGPRGRLCEAPAVSSGSLLCEARGRGSENVCQVNEWVSEGPGSLAGGLRASEGAGLGAWPPTSLLLLSVSCCSGPWEGTLLASPLSSSLAGNKGSHVLAKSKREANSNQPPRGCEKRKPLRPPGPLASQVPMV